MRFTLEPMQLTITLEGLEQLWALKRRLQIPHHAIAELDYQASVPTMRDNRGFLRIPGTAVPWRFYAGSYGHGDTREFWYLKATQPGVLVITLKAGVLTYDKVRLTCSPDIAQDVADWWQEHK
ncbi:MAG TPA: hypothetical protein VF733_01365 [Candidatus Saccharimonadales bacterium]